MDCRARKNNAFTVVYPLLRASQRHRDGAGMVPGTRMMRRACAHHSTPVHLLFCRRAATAATGTWNAHLVRVPRSPHPLVDYCISAADPVPFSPLPPSFARPPFSCPRWRASWKAPSSLPSGLCPPFSQPTKDIHVCTELENPRRRCEARCGTHKQAHPPTRLMSGVTAVPSCCDRSTVTRGRMSTRGPRTARGRRGWASYIGEQAQTLPYCCHSSPP